MTDRAISPPQYAARLGVKPSKILAWIARGELRAINVATTTAGRPRWKIPPDAILAFEENRSTRTPAKTTRRRRKRNPETISFF